MDNITVIKHLKDRQSSHSSFKVKEGFGYDLEEYLCDKIRELFQENEEQIKAVGFVGPIKEGVSFSANLFSPDFTAEYNGREEITCRTENNLVAIGKFINLCKERDFIKNLPEDICDLYNLHIIKQRSFQPLLMLEP